MKKIKRILLLLLLVLVAGYLFSLPNRQSRNLSMDLPSLPASINTLESYISSQEANFQIRPDNESRIFWANDSVKERTDFCLLYLHGFSASWYEGYPPC